MFPCNSGNPGIDRLFNQIRLQLIRTDDIKKGRCAKTAPEPGSGFTLLELMVVMLLITIVLAVAVPRFDSGILQDPVKKLTRWMLNTDRTLRSESIGLQKTYALVVDIDNNRMWVVNDTMDESAMAAAGKNAFKLPNSLRIIDVQYPHRDRDTSGTAEIKFYPAGYSDQALIHLETDDGQRITYIVEPLLPKVKFVDDWISY